MARRRGFVVTLLAGHVTARSQKKHRQMNVSGTCSPTSGTRNE